MKTREFQAALNLVVGFLIGLAALLLSSLIDLDTFDLDLAARSLSCVLAGMAWALCSLPFSRAYLSLRTDAASGFRRSLLAGAAAISLFFSITVLTNLTIPARWLFSFFAFSVLLDWSLRGFIDRLRYVRVGSSSVSNRVAAYLDSTPHAFFVTAGLFLIVQAVAYLFLNRQAQAERLANGGFSLLVAAIVFALLNIVTPQKIKDWYSRVPALGMLLLLAGAFLLSYLTRIEYTQAESAFLVDTLPSYLDVRMRKYQGNSILISDSSKLRLWNILQVYPYLDVSPDRRGSALWDDLMTALRGKQYAYWVEVPGGSNDSLGFLSSFMRANGCMDDISETILPVKPYELRTPLVAPRALPPAIAGQVVDAFEPAQIDFGPIQLTGFDYESRVCSHDALAVSLRWHLVRQTQVPLDTSLILTDPKGRQIRSQDFPIEDLLQKDSTQLPTGAQIYCNDLLVVPSGTPPGEYTLSAGVFAVGASQRLHLDAASGATAAGSDLVTLGHVRVDLPVDYGSDPYNTLQDSDLAAVKTDLADGLRLAAYAVSVRSVLPGESLTLTARWRALRDFLPSYAVRVDLKQGSEVVAETSGVPADGTYPTDQWHANQVVVDRWDLRIPPDVAGGEVQLEVSVDNGQMLPLGNVDIATVAHSFETPSASYPAAGSFGVGTLTGYDLAGTSVPSNESLALTLYWRADSNLVDLDYAVFAQLLTEDGRLIAQSDSAPAGGRRPTRGWVKGEFIPDPHRLDFVDKTYTGPAYLIVGMYDPATGKRLPIAGASEDFVKLATPILVTPP